MAAADGAAGVGVIETELIRRSEPTSNTLTLCASTTSKPAPASISLTASTAPESIRVLDSHRPLGSDQRSTYVAPGSPTRLMARRTQ
jgi:hypothetical protein